MSKKTLQFNRLMDIYNALDRDQITSDQAVRVCCASLNMIDIRFDGEIMSKDEILEQLIFLNNLILDNKDCPLFFHGKNSDFMVHDLVLLGKNKTD